MPVHSHGQTNTSLHPFIRAPGQWGACHSCCVRASVQAGRGNVDRHSHTAEASSEAATSSLTLIRCRACATARICSSCARSRACAARSRVRCIIWCERDVGAMLLRRTCASLSCVEPAPQARCAKEPLDAGLGHTDLRQLAHGHARSSGTRGACSLARTAG